MNHCSSSYTGRKKRKAKLFCGFGIVKKKKKKGLCFDSAFQRVQHYESFLLCQGERHSVCELNLPKSSVFDGQRKEKKEIGNRHAIFPPLSPFHEK